MVLVDTCTLGISQQAIILESDCTIRGTVLFQLSSLPFLFFVYLLQDCFKQNWNEHKKVHKAEKAAGNQTCSQSQLLS